MLPVIHNSAKDMSSVLDYNLDKEDYEVAMPVFGNRLPSLEQSEVIAYFEKWSHKSIKTDKLAFHMSINPSQDDIEQGCSEKDIKGYVTELMEGLGYGNQPYVVFKHSDIEREHYHVVSIRIGEDGKKIKDSNEKYKCKSITQSLEKKYHFKYGKDKTAGKKKREGNIFTRGVANVTEKFREIIRTAFTYHFTTSKQFEIIAAHFGLGLRTTDLTESKKFTLQGLDENGNGCTRPYTEEEFGMDLFETAKEKGMNNREASVHKKKEKERIVGIAGSLLKYARDEESYYSMLREKDIDIVLTRSETDDRIFGFTVVDHVTKCAFKGSELGSGLTLQMLKERMAEWKTGTEASNMKEISKAEQSTKKTGKKAGKAVRKKGRQIKL